MNGIGINKHALTSVLGAVLILLLCAVAKVRAEGDSYPVLQIGTHSYTNVTITTRARDYVFLTHSSGMATFKVASLTAEERSTLGYTNEPAKTSRGMAGLFNSKKLKKIDIPQFDTLKTQARERWGAFCDVALPKLQSLSLVAKILLASALVLIYLFFCYCCSLICRKTQQDVGLVVWLPVLQIIPLLRAARMSPLWFVPCLLVVPGLLVFLIWSFKIARARGKSLLVAFFLILPVTFPLAFLYLAFSDGDYRKAQRAPELMVLEAA